MSRIVIYGAAGFVGSTLLTDPRLPRAALTLVDKGPIPPSVLVSLRQAGNSVDAIQSSSLRGIAANEADALLVLAGQTDVDQALGNPVLAFETNMAIAVTAAEWWRQHPQARLVYLSSDEVLGASNIPLDEDAPLAPTQPYAASKAAAEMTLRCYGQSYGLELVIIRSCNLVGGRQRARKLIPTAVQNLAAGLPVPIFGDGLHLREYLAVEDLCEVVRRALTRTLPAGVYHCSSGIALKTTDVVGLIAKALTVEPTLAYVQDRLVHDRYYAMDAAKLKAHGWKPLVSPAHAIAAAAIEMRSAWSKGEVLTEKREA